MPLSALSGTRLRERRLAAGLRQADVAAAAGISASYLNLIEHNRRKVGPAVLERLAQVLGIDRAALAKGSDAVLVEGLKSAAARVVEGQAELDRLEDLVSRFPGWAALLVGLDARTQTLERAVETLNDRMTHDPHLSQSLHEVLSSLSSVRATAAILAETEDLEPEWAARFHRNLHHDSERLAAGAEAGETFPEQRLPLTVVEGEFLVNVVEKFAHVLEPRQWHGSRRLRRCRRRGRLLNFINVIRPDA